MSGNQRNSFFASRWHSKVALGVLFWRDLLFYGTLINLAAGLAAFIMLTQDVPPAWALTVHLAPVPYNIFLLLSVWRSKQTTPVVSLIAGLWFVLVLIV